MITALQTIIDGYPRWSFVTYLALIPALIYGALFSLIWEPLGWAVASYYFFRIMYVGYTINKEE